MASWFDRFIAENELDLHPFESDQRSLYCVTEGFGEPIKLGIAANVRQRFVNLKSSTWRDLYCAWTVGGTSRHERALKHLLDGMRIRNEWFADSEDWIKSLRPTNADELVNELAATLFEPDPSPLIKRSYSFEWPAPLIAEGSA